MADAGDPMDDKDKADVYLRLAEATQTRYWNRRNIEWKVHLSLWAAMIIGMGAILGGDHAISCTLKMFFIPGLIIFFLMVRGWTKKVNDLWVFPISKVAIQM